MVSSPRAGTGTITRLAERLVGDELRTPSAMLADAAARRVFDTLGALAVGRQVLPDAALPRHIDGEGGALARVRRLCALTRCSELDDIDPLGLVTPGSVVVPVALVLAGAPTAAAAAQAAARTLPSGAALLAAVAAGYEAMIATAEGLGGASLLARGVWPTYLLAPVGAAATAASLFGLDAAQTADALAIALARAAGVAGRPAREPTSRWWLCAAAAADGVLAAEAAAAGLAGDLALLERGLGADQVLDFDSGRLRRDDPVRLGVVETKPLCTARQTLPAIEAALRLRDHVGGRSIASIEVFVPEQCRAMVDRPAPTERTVSIQSAQFQVAAALSGDPVLHDPLRAPPSLGAGGHRLLGLTTVGADPELTAGYPRTWSARVTIRLAGSGERLTETCAEVAGASPQAGWHEVAAKHLRVGLDETSVAPLREACMALPRARPDAVRALLASAGQAVGVSFA